MPLGPATAAAVRAEAQGNTTAVMVIGAGQAGLSAAYHLSRLGLDHLVLDSESGPGGAWRHRWPTLTMATVNGISELPDLPTPNVDPRQSARVAVPAYFADYERLFGLLVRRPVAVRRVENGKFGSPVPTANYGSAEDIGNAVVIRSWWRPRRRASDSGPWR